jgi:hypothetical protein
LKAWYDVVKPRADLREGKPLDASEFAVHLDKVRMGTAPEDYTVPQRFFDRTYLTENLTGMAAEVVRRLSGITTETNAIFNMTTQFGGGKTHALTLLYHLARHGAGANGWRGVSKILERARVRSVPDNCAVAVFVGTEFDSITGRGGEDGTPLRKTPWGEIAWQLGGPAGFAHVARHDAEFTEPKGDVIEKFLPANRPCLILLDEVLNYASTYRDRNYHNRLYNFLQALSETVRGRTNVVMVASIPASELSYTDKDHSDQQRLKNLLDRLGKAVIVSVENETSEIIRRRLFEWDERAITPDGRIMMTKDALETCNAYAGWVQAHRQQLPSLINPDLAREQFAAAYPFHPMVISVFERKWQTLPRFQQTRGILRLLALWVSRTYQDGYKGARKEPLITLGTAPMDDAMFRAAMFEQLGETRLEAAVTTDIAGKKDSHAVRLDGEAIAAIKKARLHTKVATTIFFESNGGQVGAEATEASLPEIRLAVGDPESDIGNIETVLDALADSCYYLNVEKTRYKFSLKENLNKRFADRRATIRNDAVDDEVKKEIQNLFARKDFVERVFFPEKAIQVSDRAVLTLVILDLTRTLEDENSLTTFVEGIIRECGTSPRTFKSALVFVVMESAAGMRDEAKKYLAWSAISAEAKDLKLDQQQEEQLSQNIKTAKRDFKEAIWRGYKKLMMLDKNNAVKIVDLGLLHSSAAESPTENILNRLVADGEVEKSASPNFLVRNWPPAFVEWATKYVKDAFYISPIFPRLLNGELVKDTIARGVENGVLAYVGKSSDGLYEPFFYKQHLDSSDIEISEDMFIIKGETAKMFIEKRRENGGAVIDEVPAGGHGPISPRELPGEDGGQGQMVNDPPNNLGKAASPDKVAGIEWVGDLPPQKWMNFYTKVLSRFSTVPGFHVRVFLEVTPPEGIHSNVVTDTQNALKELGIGGTVNEKKK